MPSMLFYGGTLYARDGVLSPGWLRTEDGRIEALGAGKDVIENHNTLIGRFTGADGMKTGYDIELLRRISHRQRRRDPGSPEQLAM